MSSVGCPFTRLTMYPTWIAGKSDAIPTPWRSALTWSSEMASAGSRSASCAFSSSVSDWIWHANAASLICLTFSHSSFASISFSQRCLSSLYRLHCASASTFSSVFVMNLSFSWKSFIFSLRSSYSSRSSGFSFMSSHAVAQFWYVRFFIWKSLRSRSACAIFSSTNATASSCFAIGVFHAVTTALRSSAPAARSSESSTLSKVAVKRRRGTDSHLSSGGTYRTLRSWFFMSCTVCEMEYIPAKCLLSDTPRPAMAPRKQAGNGRAEPKHAAARGLKLLV